MPAKAQSLMKVITLDGPAGVGKSSLAKAVAAQFKIAYLDTGAMFRSVALKLGSDAANFSDANLARQLSDLHFSLAGFGADSQLSLNGKIIGDEVRSEEVGAMAAKIASLKLIRDFLKEQQQALAQDTWLVAEGRDMGSVVFPQAALKFFLDAKPEVRAQRRFLQLEEQQLPADLELLTKQICERDDLDRNRAIAPLAPASDAIIVDTSYKNMSEVLLELAQHLEKLKSKLLC